MQVERNRRVFIDSEFFFDAVPPELSHDRMTFIQTAPSEVTTVGSSVFSFDTSRPIKVRCTSTVKPGSTPLTYHIPLAFPVGFGDQRRAPFAVSPPGVPWVPVRPNGAVLGVGTL
jgi:hypothetical protein